MPESTDKRAALSNPGADQRAEEHVIGRSNDGAGKKHRKRRARLSCGECREKKLSCDRGLPCQRCVRAGRPGLCSFESGAGQRSALVGESVAHQAQLHNNQIRQLQAEVSQLRSLLAGSFTSDDGDRTGGTVPAARRISPGPSAVPDRGVEEDYGLGDIANPELSNPTERSPRGYYGQHSLFRFFSEIPQLFPCIKEIYDGAFNPFGVRFRKNKPAKNNWKSASPLREDDHWDVLLPPQAEADALVFFYLDHFEHIHRIVHIPTFKRTYSLFWTAGRTRHPATTVLVLAMMAISCASADLSDPMLFSSRGQNKPTQWISACEDWLRNGSLKHRNIVHYQISCLVYIAKRVNMIDKKNFWTETGFLLQSAIIDGLHRNPAPELDSPYTVEMKRRIWTTIRELALQNSFEYGLPTLLYNVDSDVAPPANLDDEAFHQTSKELPDINFPTQYTSASYQSYSSYSWVLRLEISRRLHSTGLVTAPDYDEVLQYTHQVSQAISSLPSWDVGKGTDDALPKVRLLSHAFLRLQLMECILALHRPYLKRSGGKFWLSETVVYQTSLEMLHLNRNLGVLGIQSPALLREDLLLASLNLARITMLQPKESANIIMLNCGATLDLLQQCLPLMEDIYLRLVYSRPWCFMTLCACVMILKIHIGKDSYQTARILYSQLLIDLYHKQIERQKTPALSSQDLTLQHVSNQIEVSVSQASAATTTLNNYQLQHPGDNTALFPDPWLLDINDLDICINPFDLDLY